MEINEYLLKTNENLWNNYMKSVNSNGINEHRWKSNGIRRKQMGYNVIHGFNEQPRQSMKIKEN